MSLIGSTHLKESYTRIYTKITKIIHLKKKDEMKYLEKKH